MQSFTKSVTVQDRNKPMPITSAEKFGSPFSGGSAGTSIVSWLQ